MGILSGPKMERRSPSSATAPETPRSIEIPGVGGQARRLTTPELVDYAIDWARPSSESAADAPRLRVAVTDR